MSHTVHQWRKGGFTRVFDDLPLPVMERVNHFVTALEEVFVASCIDGVRKADKKGVRLLGADLRKKNIDNLLSTVLGEYSMFRCTENRRAFLFVFVNHLVQYPGTAVVVIILSKDFNTRAKIVDTSAIGLQEVEEQLFSLETGLGVELDVRNLYVVEIDDFDSYDLRTDSLGNVFIA